MNKKLAEFIGIILGDGTLTKYFLRISLNSLDEKPYANYISTLCENLFGIKPSITKEKNRNLLKIELRSVRVCKFLNEILNIPYGDKINNNCKIPQVIMNNDLLAQNCLRGLIDTDGSISDYVYFTSYNPLFIKQVVKLNEKFQLFSSTTK